MQMKTVQIEVQIPVGSEVKYVSSYNVLGTDQTNVVVALRATLGQRTGSATTDCRKAPR